MSPSPETSNESSSSSCTNLYAAVYPPADLFRAGRDVMLSKPPLCTASLHEKVPPCVALDLAREPTDYQDLSFAGRCGTRYEAIQMRGKMGQDTLFSSFFLV